MRPAAVLPAVLALLLLASAPPSAARVDTWHQDVAAVDVDLRGQGVVILAQQTVTVGAPGRVLVHFDGQCCSAPGDLIAFAAEDEPHWDIGEARTTVRAYTDDINLTLFSHSRVFDVEPGAHTFYAMGQNVEVLDGTGVASVQGSLTVTFVPDWDRNVGLWHRGIAVEGFDLRGGNHIVTQHTVGVMKPGHVLVRFDGYARSTYGDRVDIWVNNTPGFTVSDGLVAVEAPDGVHNLTNFSHARLYPVTAGMHTFYVMASSLVEMGGAGVADFYGNMTIQYFADTGPARVASAGVVEFYIDVSAAPVMLGEVTIEAPQTGTAVVDFEGICFASERDRVVLASSDDPAWTPGESCVGVEIMSLDSNHDCFAQTLSYRVDAPGPHTFYALCQTAVETEGAGMASVFANLGVVFLPDEPADAGDGMPAADIVLEPNYPNPFNPATTITFELAREDLVTLRVYDIAGHLVRTLTRGIRPPGRWTASWDGRNERGGDAPSGTYLYLLSVGDTERARKMQLLR